LLLLRLATAVHGNLLLIRAGNPFPDLLSAPANRRTAKRNCPSKTAAAIQEQEGDTRFTCGNWSWIRLAKTCPLCTSMLSKAVKGKDQRQGAFTGRTAQVRHFESRARVRNQSALPRLRGHASPAHRLSTRENAFVPSGSESLPPTGQRHWVARLAAGCSFRPGIRFCQQLTCSSGGEPSIDPASRRRASLLETPEKRFFWP